VSRGPVVTVEGMRSLRRSLQDAGLGLEDLTAAHARVAQTIANRAAARAPHRTGRLAASVRSSGTKTAAWVRAGKAATPYAGPIHWGWPSRPDHALGWRGGVIHAQPFIYNAAGELEDVWLHIYLSELNRLIAQVEGAPGP
jgi:hypothetical protein